MNQDKNLMLDDVDPVGSIPPDADYLDPEPDYLSSGLMQGVCFFLLALIWYGFIYFIAKDAVAKRLWIFVLSFILLSIPICMFTVYNSTICQIRRLNSFVREGWIFRLLSRRALKIFLSLGWALLTAPFMLVQFHGYRTVEWVAFFLVIPVFWTFFLLSRKLIAAELKPYLVTNMALIYARRLSCLIMVVVYVALMLFVGEEPKYLSVGDAIEDKQSAIVNMRGSAVGLYLSRLYTISEGTRAYIISRMGSENILLAIILQSCGSFVIFYNACTILCFLLIRRVEYRRMFGKPLSDAEHPHRVPISRIFAVSGILTFVVLFIYVHVVVRLELMLQQNPEVRLAVQERESAIVQILEKVDGAFFQEGTIDQLRQAKFEALRRVDMARFQLDRQIDRTFDQIEANVDKYLDWYYSLAGEYARIGSVLVGDVEEMLARKLEELLEEGVPLEELNIAFDNCLAESEAASAELKQAVEKILGENRVDPEDRQIRVKEVISLSEVLNPKDEKAGLGLGARLTGSGSVSGVVAVFTVMISKKIMGKGALKIAAKSIIKIVAGKAAGTTSGVGAGAAVGAAVGSVVPGPGSAVGAVVGGIIGGVAAGVTVDKMMLMLEESFNREDFKKELISAIEEARKEYRDLVHMERAE
jgi:hypothetical protein